jgi:hypothetical protein
MTQLIVEEQHPARKSYYSSTTLVLIAISTAYYSRVVCAAAHLPSFLNFLHFAVVPLTCTVVMATTKLKDRQQLKIAWSLLTGMFILFTIEIASSLLNDAGPINAVFHFLMFAEPFMLLLVIVCIPSSPSRTKQLKTWLIYSAFINLGLAFIQYPLIASGHLNAKGLDATDGTAGVFFPSGAGNYVTTTVAIYFGLYYLGEKTVSLWLRYATLFAAVVLFKITDSKQVLAALLIGWLGVIISNSKRVGRTLAYIILFVLVIWGFFWCVENLNLEFLEAFKNYADKQGAYGPDGAATQIKTTPFWMIPNYYTSPFNWLLGLGPGHTVGRLGGWLIKENWAILGPLGATIHPLSSEMWAITHRNWIAMESTIFSPFFGWAGLWGDLGFLGLAAYLYLGWLVWHALCPDNLSKFLLLSVAGFGFIFTQMEEPGFMLFSAVLIGIRWQERRTVP